LKQLLLNFFFLAGMNKSAEAVKTGKKDFVVVASFAAVGETQGKEEKLQQEEAC